jgi:hypothetical protein
MVCGFAVGIVVLKIGVFLKLLSMKRKVMGKN